MQRKSTPRFARLQCQTIVRFMKFSDSSKIIQNGSAASELTGLENIQVSAISTRVSSGASDHYLVSQVEDCCKVFEPVADSPNPEISLVG